jgi:hypothetical protein
MVLNLRKQNDMKRKDLVFILFLILLFIPFFVFSSLSSFYLKVNAEHGFLTAFVKFAVLATAGELAGLRIRTGNFFIKGFGIIPRAIVWGVLGIFIKIAFMIFSAGVPPILGYLGMHDPSAALTGTLSIQRVLVAFSISLFLNLFFSPVLMTLHRVTDAHIHMGNGSMNGFLRKINVLNILETIDWRMHWGFVLKKTIPFFWIPAHTLTFLLPPDFQVLFAAVLGIVLGVILAFAADGHTDK